MPDQTHVRQSTRFRRAARRRHPGGIRRARHEGRRIHRRIQAPRRGAMGAGERRARRRQGMDRSGLPPAPAGQRPRCRCRARPHHAGRITAISWCWRTRRRCTTSSAARCAPARPSRSSGCRRTGTRISNIAPASCASRAPCSRKWASTCRRRSRSACGTPRPTPATWCCRCGRPETVGWSEEKLAKIVTKDSMIGVARL